MALVVFQVDRVFQIFIDVRLCSVDILYILVCISWHLLKFLATSNSFWLVPTFFVVLDGQHLQNYDFPVKSILWGFCCFGYRFILLCIWFHLVPRLDCFLSLIFVLLPVLWYYFFVFLPVNWNPPMTYIFSISLFWLWFLFKVLLWASWHLCYSPMYLLSLFLTRYLLLCLFFPKCAIVWSHSLVTLDTI